MDKIFTEALEDADLFLSLLEGTPVCCLNSTSGLGVWGHPDMELDPLAVGSPLNFKWPLCLPLGTRLQNVCYRLAAAGRSNKEEFQWKPNGTNPSSFKITASSFKITTHDIQWSLQFLSDSRIQAPLGDSKDVPSTYVTATALNPRKE